MLIIIMIQVLLSHALSSEALSISKINRASQKAQNADSGVNSEALDTQITPTETSSETSTLRGLISGEKQGSSENSLGSLSRILSNKPSYHIRLMKSHRREPKSNPGVTAARRSIEVEVVGKALKMCLSAPKSSTEKPKSKKPKQKRRKRHRKHSGYFYSVKSKSWKKIRI